jgi:hypothetical protein
MSNNPEWINVSEFLVYEDNYFLVLNTWMKAKNYML